MPTLQDLLSGSTNDQTDYLSQDPLYSAGLSLQNAPDIRYKTNASALWGPIAKGLVTGILKGAGTSEATKTGYADYASNPTLKALSQDPNSPLSTDYTKDKPDDWNLRKGEADKAMAAVIAQNKNTLENFIKQQAAAKILDYPAGASRIQEAVKIALGQKPSTVDPTVAVVASGEPTSTATSAPAADSLLAKLPPPSERDALQSVYGGEAGAEMFKRHVDAALKRAEPGPLDKVAEDKILSGIIGIKALKNLKKTASDLPKSYAITPDWMAGLHNTIYKNYDENSPYATYDKEALTAGNLMSSALSATGRQPYHEIKDLTDTIRQHGTATPETLIKNIESAQRQIFDKANEYLLSTPSINQDRVGKLQAMLEAANMPNEEKITPDALKAEAADLISKGKAPSEAAAILRQKYAGKIGG